MADEGPTPQQLEALRLMRERRKERVLGTDCPTCPYCRHRHEFDETQWEEEFLPCEGCGKTFLVCTERTVRHDNLPAGLCPACGGWQPLSAGVLPPHRGRAAGGPCPGAGQAVKPGEGKADG